MTRRVCIRCGTLQPANGGQPCTACGASSFSLVPEKVQAVSHAAPVKVHTTGSLGAVSATGGLTVDRDALWPGAGEDERDYSPETP